jgi:voltage-gated potassium channel
MPSLRRASGRYVILLASLIVLVTVRPLLVGQYVQGQWVESIAGLLILVFAASVRPRVFVIATVLFAVALGSSIVLLVTWSETAATRHLVLTVCTVAAVIVFLGFICGVILYDVLVRMPVTWNTVCGSLCVYLLGGAICAYLYMLIYLTDPTSFAGAYPAAAIASLDALDRHMAVFTYYSFATLATLGMGDITPRSALTRTLSWMEAVLGQIYLAVLVARLIALQRSPGDVTES